MNRQLYQFFIKDHRRIDELLDLAIKNPDEMQMEYYHRFRAGLLTHIKMEEKVLFNMFSRDCVPLSINLLRAASS